MTAKRLALLVAATFLSVLTAQSAFAQTGTLFGNSGTTGSTGRSTGLTTGTSGFGSTGTSGFGGTGTTGFGATGTSGFGGTGTSGFGQTTGQTGRTQTGTTGTNGFIGRGNTTLVGQQNASQQGRTQNRTFQGVNNSAAQNVNQNFNQGGTQSQNTVRPVVRVAFNHPIRTNAVLSTTVVTRFQRLTVRHPRFRGVTVAMAEGHEVVLKGTVDSDTAKSLAENYARMEPGVRSVRNELVVKK